MAISERDESWMRRALALARLGEGLVEPNPMVGCVIVRDGNVLAEGFHRRYGELHAERDAISRLDGDQANTTVYVTLEPCSHFGKQPPCVDALLELRPSRVVVGTVDPNPLVSGNGIKRLVERGIQVEVGCLARQAEELIRPFACLMKLERPWVLAKWAMTLDGCVATRSGDSRWISNERSRAVVHQIRGRCDAIVVGIGTVRADDPLLTARPTTARLLHRVVLDSKATLEVDSQLVRTIDQAPLIVVCDENAAPDSVERLKRVGVTIWALPTASRSDRVKQIVKRMGEQKWTNVLVEGGAQVLGAFADADLIDEVHTFIAAKVLGGGLSPVSGQGKVQMKMAWQLPNPQIELLDGDVYVSGRRP